MRATYDLGCGGLVAGVGYVADTKAGSGLLRLLASVPRGAATFDADTWTRLRDRVRASISTGFERTQVQDVAFGLRQLTDVATKALSPGINDPTTAVHALGHSSALLVELAGREMGARLLRDERGAVRVTLRRPDLADVLELAIAQPRRYGAADPAVLSRLGGLLYELAWVVRQPEQHRAVADQLTRLRATTAAQDFDPAERAHLDTLTARVQHALVGRWIPDGRNE